MSNLDNVNINNAGRAYHCSIKKGEDAKQQVKPEENTAVESLNDGTKAAESYGRILVKAAGKTENPEMIKTVQDALEFYVNNPQLAQASVKSGDDAYELLEAMGAENPYEKSCCGSCDAAYAKNN